MRLENKEGEGGGGKGWGGQALIKYNNFFHWNQKSKCINFTNSIKNNL